MGVEQRQPLRHREDDPRWRIEAEELSQPDAAYGRRPAHEAAVEGRGDLRLGLESPCGPVSRGGEVASGLPRSRERRGPAGCDRLTRAALPAREAEMRNSLMGVR